MTRTRLRSAYTPDELARVYAQPHDHTRWHDHELRVAVTIDLARWFTDVTSAADLSCGNAAIAKAIAADTTILGDYAPGYPITGPIEQTIHETPDVDLFICSETIEHLDQPDTVLAAIRKKTRYLILSTPVDADQDANPEHYWSWDREGVEDMLTTAGFTTDIYATVDTRPGGYYYCFGIWAAR